MSREFNYGDFKVTLSDDETRATFSNDGRITPVRYRGNDRYIVQVITKDNGCPKSVKKLLLDRK